jgi:hypothetical protein
MLTLNYHVRHLPTIIWNWHQHARVFDGQHIFFFWCTCFPTWLLHKNEKKLARSFKFTFCYIDDVLSLNNTRFGDFVDRIYPIELEIKDITDTDRYASQLDIHIEIESERRLRTKLYDKRDDFNFPIVNFLFMCSNIRAAPAYRVYISQLIGYSRACGSYLDFLDRGLLLTRKLLNQGFLFVKLKSSLWKSWLGGSLWNICVTNDTWYVPLAVNRSFLNSWLIIGLVTRLRRRVLSVLRYSDSDYPFGIFKLFSRQIASQYKLSIQIVIY